MHSHVPMNFDAVRDHLANSTRRNYCPRSGCWESLRPSDWFLEHLEQELLRRRLVPNRPNALDLAKPVIADTVVRSGAYCSRLPLTSPCSANFRDMLDIQFSLGVAQTRALVKRVRRAATLLAEHCESKGIVAQAWKSRVGYARLSNPCFATRVILQGAAAEVREGYGEQLLKQWRKSPDPLTLIDRALGGGGMVSKFLDAMVKGVPGDFGEGRLVWSRTTADRADRTHALAGQA